MTLTILIPEATLKFVIGKSGRQLRLLRSRVGMISLWLDSETHKLTVRGEAAAVNLLAEEVKTIVTRAERTLRLPLRLAVADPPAVRDDVSDLSDSDIAEGRRVDDHSEDIGSGAGRLCIVDTIAIPTPAVPSLLGKKGATINRLGGTRGITNVRMEVDSEGGDVLRIEGEPDSVTAVMIEVQSILKRLRESDKILRAAELARVKAAAWSACDTSTPDHAEDSRRAHHKRAEAAKIDKRKEALRFPR
jgi:hypothetical protein